MEYPPPPKHDNKNKNRKTTINIGNFGTSGIVLVGGAIVTATLVSAAFAFRNRRQKQSRSSKETQHSDDVTSTNEMESKTIHDSSPAEKLNCGTNDDIKVHRGDGNGNDESTLIHVDSVFESEQVDDRYEKIVMENGEVVMEGQMELVFPSSKEDTCNKDGDEEQKHPMLIDNEKVDSKSIASDEYEASKVAFEVEESVQNEKGGEAAQYGRHFLSSKKKKIFCADMEAIKAACADMEDILEMHENELHRTIFLENQPTQFMNEEETSQKVEQFASTEDDLVNKEKDRKDEIPDVQVINDQPVEREDNPPTQSMSNEEKGDETEIKKDDLVDEDEHSHVKEDREAKVVTVNSRVTSEVAEESTREEPSLESVIVKDEKNIEENTKILGKVQNGGDQNGIEKDDKGSKSAATFIAKLTKGSKQALANKPWNLKVRTWSVLVSIWCIFHWYSELPFPELSLLCSLMLILILLGYRNRTTYLVKYE